MSFDREAAIEIELAAKRVRLLFEAPSLNLPALRAAQRRLEDVCLSEQTLVVCDDDGRAQYWAPDEASAREVVENASPFMTRVRRISRLDDQHEDVTDEFCRSWLLDADNGATDIDEWMAGLPKFVRKHYDEQARAMFRQHRAEMRMDELVTRPARAEEW